MTLCDGSVALRRDGIDGLRCIGVRGGGPSRMEPKVAGVVRRFRRRADQPDEYLRDLDAGAAVVCVERPRCPCRGVLGRHSGLAAHALCDQDARCDP